MDGECRKACAAGKKLDEAAAMMGLSGAAVVGKGLLRLECGVLFDAKLDKVDC